MNRWQVARQLRYLLNKRKWEGNGANELVLGARVTAGPTEAGYDDLRLPFAFILPVGGPADDEEPGLWQESFLFTLVAGVEGDEMGEESLIGAARSRAQASSAGRGLFELEEELFAALNVLTTQFGIEKQARHRRTVKPTLDQKLGYVAGAEYEYDIWVTAKRFYHPVTNLVGTAIGGGQAQLSWTLPPDRFDRRQIIVRRAAGSTPPASPTAGSAVAIAELATGVTDNPGAGTFSYAVFAAYLETVNDDQAPPTSGTPDRYSEAMTVTIVVT